MSCSVSTLSSVILSQWLKSKMSCVCAFIAMALKGCTVRSTKTTLTIQSMQLTRPQAAILNPEGLQQKIRLEVHRVLGSAWPAYWAVQWRWFAQVNALCNLLCKKSREVTASLLGRFLSWRYFMLCITMEVEPRIAKQHKCHHGYSCKNYWGKEMEGGKKVFLRHFWLTRRPWVWGKNAFWGIL